MNILKPNSRSELLTEKKTEKKTKKKFFPDPIIYKQIDMSEVPERILNLLKEYVEKYYSLNLQGMDSFNFKVGEIGNELHFKAIDNWLIIDKEMKKEQWVTFVKPKPKVSNIVNCQPKFNQMFNDD